MRRGAPPGTPTLGPRRPHRCPLGRKVTSPNRSQDVRRHHYRRVRRWAFVLFVAPLNKKSKPGPSSGRPSLGSRPGWPPVEVGSGGQGQRGPAHARLGGKGEALPAAPRRRRPHRAASPLAGCQALCALSLSPNKDRAAAANDVVSTLKRGHHSDGGGCQGSPRGEILPEWTGK